MASSSQNGFRVPIWADQLFPKWNEHLLPLVFRRFASLYPLKIVCILAVGLTARAFVSIVVVLVLVAVRLCAFAFFHRIFSGLHIYFWVTYGGHFEVSPRFALLHSSPRQI